jgi:hypothetical protein
MMAASVWLCDLLGLTQLLPALYFGEITWKDSPSWSHLAWCCILQEPSGHPLCTAGGPWICMMILLKSLFSLTHFPWPQTDASWGERAAREH